jgi:serine/threonine protein kinase
MKAEPLLGGRYELCAQIGAGGMATVHLGKLRGARGFSRVVAIKRLFPHLAGDGEVVAMFLDEARLASRVEHPNVVRVTDVVGAGNEIFLVMDYVAGITLAELVKAHDGQPLPLSVALLVMHDALAGLSAAHHATSQGGQPLRLVHRDVSPQNLLIGADGITRVLDFGIAKADGRLQQRTRTNETKGKLAYMAPEQLAGEPVDERTDIYAAGICLWEITTGKRAYSGSDAHVMRQIMEQPLAPASAGNAALPAGLDALIDRATAKEPSARFGTAAEMARAIEALSVPLASRDQVRSLLEARAASALEERATLVAHIEATDPADAAHAPVADEGVAVDAAPRSADRPRVRFLFPAIGVALVILGIVALWFQASGRLDAKRAAPSTEASTSAAEPAPSASSAIPADTVEPAAVSAAPEPAPSVKRPSRPAGSNRRETLY